MPTHVKVLGAKAKHKFYRCSLDFNVKRSNSDTTKFFVYYNKYSIGKPVAHLHRDRNEKFVAFVVDSSGEYREYKTETFEDIIHVCGFIKNLMREDKLQCLDQK